jgi:hypothetical protein
VFEIVRKLHKPGNRVQDTATDALQRLAGAEQQRGDAKSTNAIEIQPEQEFRQRWGKDPFRHGGTIDLKVGRNDSAIPLDSTHAGLRKALAIWVVEVSDEDENSVGSVAAKSEGCTHEGMKVVAELW